MILVFGATGYTGRLVTDALVARGLPVRIAGRSQERLEKLSARHGGLEWVVADVEDAGSVRRAAEGTSVLVTTVGPYTWWGEIAVEAALAEGIPYIDITGEPSFIRRVFEEFGPRAEAAGVPLLTTIGYDYVPGNLAGAMALEAAGAAATRIDVGYFLRGETSRSTKSFSDGTLRSLKASSTATQFAFHGGRIQDERGAKHVLDFDIEGRPATAVSIGSTEHFALPRIHPQLTDVNVGLGWFGPAARTVSVASAVMEKAESMPVVGDLVHKVAERVTGTGDQAPRTEGKETPGGPTEDARAKARTYVVAIARDAGGSELATVRLEGPGPYDLTGGIVAWAAERAHAGAITGAGALGPVEAFGLDPLRTACAEIGLVEA